MFQENVIVGNDGKPINFIPSRAIAITEHITDTFDPGLLYVGTGGDVSVIPANGTTEVVFKNVPDGTFLPVYIKAVRTASTAADLVICY